MREVNPLKRLRVEAGLTMVDVANEAGVSRQFVIRSEQGVFNGMPASVANALLDLRGSSDPLDYQELDALYNDWQRLRRVESYGTLLLRFDFHNHPNSSEPLIHPFIHWRKHSGITARIIVCKMFCVHPALMFKFEEQPWLCNTPPSELLVGLRQSGYTDEITYLELAYDEYRKARRTN